MKKWVTFFLKNLFSKNLLLCHHISKKKSKDFFQLQDFETIGLTF